MAPAPRGNLEAMRLLKRLRRRRQQPDHPLDAAERVEEATRPHHWWEQAQEIGGANSWGRVDAEHDLKPPQ
jgi:hypothetical protein